MDKDFQTADEFSLSSEQNTNRTRKNVDFHSLFRSIPAKENLISCKCDDIASIIFSVRLCFEQRYFIAGSSFYQ